MRLLLDNGADVNTQAGYFGTALQAAVAMDGYLDMDPEDVPDIIDPVPAKVRLEVVQLLLDRGANVNAVGGHRGTALRAASCYGEEDVVKVLLERGADPSLGLEKVDKAPLCS